MSLKRGHKFKEILSVLARAWTLGWEVAVATLIPLLAGLWIDKRWGTSPWFTLVGVGAGVFLGIAVVYLDTRRAIEEIENRYRSEEDIHQEKQ